MIPIIVPPLVASLLVVGIGGLVSPPPRRPPGPTSLVPTVNDEAGRGPTRRRVLLRRVGLVSAVAVGWLILGALPVVAVLTVRWAWPRVRAIVEQRNTKRRIDASLPDAIEMLILVIQAGMTPHQAVLMLEERAPVPIRPAFAEVRHRVTRGATLADALRALPATLGPSASIVADTLAIAERYGTPIGSALEQMSLDVRERRRRHAEAEARKLPVRMSFPLVACTLPSFVLVAIVPAVLAALSSLDTSGL